MKTAMESIKEMVDVNTVIGDPVETPDGSVIIPISRVACGFGAGGGDYAGGGDGKGEEPRKHPFGGGSGAGVSVQPMGFLVVGNGQIRLLPVDNNAIFDRVIDMIPVLLDKMQSMCNKNDNKPETSSTMM
jgi:sporulation protein YtfJ